jgi:hypothetical protein
VAFSGWPSSSPASSYTALKTRRARQRSHRRLNRQINPRLSRRSVQNGPSAGRDTFGASLCRMIAFALHKQHVTQSRWRTNWLLHEQGMPDHMEPTPALRASFGEKRCLQITSVSHRKDGTKPERKIPGLRATLLLSGQLSHVLRLARTPEPAPAPSCGMPRCGQAEADRYL